MLNTFLFFPRVNFFIFYVPELYKFIIAAPVLPSLSLDLLVYMTCFILSALASPRVYFLRDIITSPGKASGAIYLIILISSTKSTSPVRLI